jgi:hypothetical protein
VSKGRFQGFLGGKFDFSGEEFHFLSEPFKIPGEDFNFPVSFLTLYRTFQQSFMFQQGTPEGTTLHMEK